jgi:hypothetical protein
MRERKQERIYIYKEIERKMREIERRKKDKIEKGKERMKD